MDFNWKPYGTTQKEMELTGLDYFLPAYERATGREITVLEYHEQPDFLCAWSDSQKVGIELSAVRRDPRDEQAQRILSKQYEMDSEEALFRFQDILHRKDSTRAKHYGEWADNTILVIQLFECSLSSLAPHLGSDIEFSKKIGYKSLRGEFQEVGFVEVWLADYTLIEAFGVVELFGLKPLEMWGHYLRPDHLQKPHG